MSWQDELQKLDAELASGRVSADEYRQRRDALLSGDTRAPQGGSFSPPPPLQWQAVPPTPPAPATSEKTQYIQPVQPAPAAPQQNSDKTQVVSVNGGGQANPNPDATQVVPNSGGFPQPNYGQPQQFSQGGWQQQQGGSSAPPPPWVTGDDSFSTPSWNQGPEVFDSAGGSSGKGKKIVGIVIVVLLLAGIGVAGFFYFTGKKDNEAQPPPEQISTPATPTTKPVPDPPAQKPDSGATVDSIFGPLPGTERAGGGQFDLPKMAAQKLMVGKTTEALVAGGMTEATLSTSVNDKNTLSIMAMAVTDQAAASKSVAAYLQDQAALKENKDLSYKGVKVVTDPAKKVLRATYVYYNKMIVVEVFTSDAGSAAETEFKELLKNQLEFAPPTVR
ncbi:hypothetical protein [Lentzea sp. NPDC055074]